MKDQPLVEDELKDLIHVLEGCFIAVGVFFLSDILKVTKFAYENADLLKVDIQDCLTKLKNR